MTVGTVLVIVLAVVLVALVAAVVFRMVTLSERVTPAILRTPPRADGSGWRHGVIRYGDNALGFFKLSSLRPGPDRRISRQGIEVGERRPPRDAELDVMSTTMIVVEVSDGADRYELALDHGALTAFLSWVESRPSGRSERRRGI